MLALEILYHLHLEMDGLLKLVPEVIGVKIATIGKQPRTLLKKLKYTKDTNQSMTRKLENSSMKWMTYKNCKILN